MTQKHSFRHSVTVRPTLTPAYLSIFPQLPCTEDSGKHCCDATNLWGPEVVWGDLVPRGSCWSQAWVCSFCWCSTPLIQAFPDTYRWAKPALSPLWRRGQEGSSSRALLPGVSVGVFKRVEEETSWLLGLLHCYPHRWRPLKWSLEKTHLG